MYVTSARFALINRYQVFFCDCVTLKVKVLRSFESREPLAQRHRIDCKSLASSTLLFIPLAWPFCQWDTNEHVHIWFWVTAETIRRIWEEAKVKTMNQFTVRYLIFLAKYYTDDKGERGGWDMWHAWGRRDMHTEFWWGDLKQRDCMVDLGVDGRVTGNK